ncbi:MAG: KOW domain-containing protein [Thaumarchaeota archaeon CSP1-1]|nr:MAG: KOW domain-containing protein [Thaumarchaeota archaeon CSP1-1]
MKPTKIRNQQIYRATYAIRSKQISGSLSKELRKKYGKRSIRINVDDTVRIIRGEYKGIDGKVTKISTEKSGVAIEGIKKEKLKGEKIDVYIPSSNVLIIGLNTDDHWRKSKLEGHKPKATSKETKLEKSKETKLEKPKETKSKKSSKLKTKETKD